MTTALGLRQLSGHLTPSMGTAPLVGRVEPSKTLNLTLGLVMKDPDALSAAAAQVSDPQDPSYRHYLTPEQFADRFGATADEFEQVLSWARSKNLTVTPHRNRLAAEAVGRADDIEAAFHVQLSYRLREDGSQFYAPDAEPSIEASVPIEHIGDLEDYDLPVPATGGSGPGGAGPAPISETSTPRARH